MKVLLSILAFNILFFNLSLAQDILYLDDNNPSVDLSKNIFVFEDTKGAFSFEEISSEEFQQNFKSYDKEKINFGFSSSNVWIRLKIKNNSESIYPWFLEINYAPLDSIVVHYTTENDSTNWKKALMGDQVPIDKWPVFHKSSVFPIKQLDHVIHTYYIRVRTKGGLQIPLSLKKFESFNETTYSSNLIFGSFYGIMLVMFLYNLLLYFFIRISSYIYYCIYILGFVTTQLAMIGHGYQYFWGNKIWIAEVIIPVSMFTSMLFGILFGIKFLNTKLYLPRWHKVLIFFIYFAATFIVLSFYLDYNITIKIATLTSITSSILMFVIGLKIWIKGNISALYYVIAWASLFIGLITIMLLTAGIIPKNFFTTNAVFFGGVVEVILLSLALADRINQYRNDKENAQALALAQLEENERIVKEQNKILEQKVTERTKEIEAQNLEISTQNEELQQQQEEITAQRDFIEKKNNELSLKNFQIETSINTAQTIQQAILPINQKLSELFNEYFVIYRPKDIVSGDFYWADIVDDKIVVAAIDCTGHGVPGAFMSLIGSTQMDKIVRVIKHTRPSDILTNLHNEVRHLLRQDQTDSKHGMDAAVVVIESINEDSNKVTFAGAKRPLYYLDELGELKSLKGDRKSIGGIQNENKVFTNQEIILKSDSIIYIGSDGFEDQNDVSRKKLGSAQFKSFLNDIKLFPLKQQKEQLE